MMNLKNYQYVHSEIDYNRITKKRQESNLNQFFKLRENMDSKEGTAHREFVNSVTSETTVDSDLFMDRLAGFQDGDAEWTEPKDYLQELLVFALRVENF